MGVRVDDAPDAGIVWTIIDVSIVKGLYLLHDWILT
jgi:hypothetical protein